jgi:SAM-dependent methyltransferase
MQTAFRVTDLIDSFIERGRSVNKTPLSRFLSGNPFPHPSTAGFFYREKMRAIHRIAPDIPLKDILELGGGQSGLTAMLYPEADIINLDLNAGYARAHCNNKKRIRFVCGDATALPFKNSSFDAVTMFDLLEHIPDHEKAGSEALRVLRPGGFILVSSPNENWRFPYYGFLKLICPTEAEMFAEWGHVRRGYSLNELGSLLRLRCQKHVTFINPLTVLCHDISFSHLPKRLSRGICHVLSPLTLLGYALQNSGSTGTETASVWQKEKTG